jgi:hypothetical protein
MFNSKSILENSSTTSSIFDNNNSSFLFSDIGFCNLDNWGINKELEIVEMNIPLNTTNYITHIEVRSGILFVSSDSSLVSDPDFSIFDIGDKDNIRDIANIDTGPGLSDFSLIGNKVFATANSKAHQVHLLEFDDTNGSFVFNLNLKNKYRLIPPYATATLPFGSAISFHNRENEKRIFTGTEKWDGGEFTSLNVDDYPNISEDQSLEVGSKLNDILLSGEDVLIANASTDEFLRINKDSFVVGNKLSPSGSSRQDGKIVFLGNKRLFFGRTSGGYDIASDHELFFRDLSDYPIDIDWNIGFKSVNVPGGVYGIYENEDLIFIATRGLNGGLLIYSEKDDTFKNYVLPYSPHSMACDGDSLYFVALDTAKVYEISQKI